MDYKPAGYLRAGKMYISISFIFAVLLGMLSLAALYAAVFHETVVHRWYAMQELPEFRIDSPYLAGYTGQARLLLTDSTLLYEGGLSGALAQGEGKLYDDGILVYEGGFDQSLYSGRGTAYYPNGAIMYKGGFEGNEYAGEGMLYDTAGNLLYAGEFAGGQYIGAGTLHIERNDSMYTYVGDFDSGNAQTGIGKLYRGAELIYEGGFENGEYHGSGTEYANGVMVYSGGFINGLRDGGGVLYRNGEMRYNGTFTAGEFDGAGKLYGAGEALIYEGGFVSGKYEGEGRLYLNGVLYYAGGFSNGVFSGAGVRYTGGTPLYEGGFANGAYDGAGKLYNNATLLYDGEFLKGVYSGEGKLYDDGGLLLYEGGFFAGEYEGAGKLYQGGVLAYEGGFARGKYNGDGTEYDINTGFPVFSGRYADNVRMEAGTEFGEDGSPLVPPPSPKADPASYIGWDYAETAAVVTDSPKELSVDGMLLMIDSGAETVYCFSVLDDGAMGYLQRLYYYGLMSADGIVVGMDISDVPRQPDAPADMGLIERVILSQSNALTALDVQAAQVRGAVFEGYDYIVTAYYLPPETVEEPAEEPEPSGRILFLRVELNAKG